MITPATLTAIPVTTTNNSSNMNSNKCKSKENIISVMTRKTTEHPQLSTNEIDNSFTRNISTFRIPKKIRSNDNIPSSDGIQSSPIQTNDNILSSSLQVVNIKPNLSPVHHVKEEINSQQGKRKVSLSQYKEHKRLKPNDITSNFSADIDMRINPIEHLKNSPPTTTMDIDSSILFNNQTVVSPKTNNISKDVVIKSNLCEPGFKKLIKKKVIWADEKNQALVHTSVFEIDDSEVTDIHAFARQCATNISLAQIEKLMERDFRKRQGLQDIQSFDNHDNQQNLSPLPTLIRILLPDTIPIPLVKSQERFVQEEREKIVLQALLMREFLLDSPGEPDGDLLGNSMIEQNEPKLIPLDYDSSKSASDQVSSVNNNNDSTSTSVSLASTTPTSTITPSLSSLSLANISPEVAQILAQAKEKATSSTTNDTSSTIVNTPINPSPAIPTTNPTLASLQNLATTPNFLSTFLNATRPSSIETANVLPTNPLVNPVSNLPLNLNVQPPNLSLNQLIVNALALGFSLPPPTTAFNNSIFQTPPSALTPINPNNNPAINPSTIRFVSPPSQQTPRFNQNNNHRGNNRGRIYRRGLHNNNNNNRRDFYQNRNNNNNNNNNNPNNNRNIFS